MSIVIIGAGTLGAYLAESLSKEKQNVILIDRDRDTLERFQQEADVASVLNSGTNWECINEIVTNQKPILFAAMTGSDETNLVACNIAKSLGIPHTVARISNPSFLDNRRIEFERLFLIDEMIAPNVLVANDLAKNLINSCEITCETFAHGMIHMHTFALSDKWAAKKQNIQKIINEDELMLGLIKRGEEILFPKNREELKPGDIVSFIGEAGAISKLATQLDINRKDIKAVLIFGGSQTTEHLARMLHERGLEIKIIEECPDTCKELAEKLPFATILNHDPTDIPFLKEERIHLFDVAVSCSVSTERNILTSTLAMELGIKDVITVMSDISYSPLLKRLGIASVVSEKISLTNRILSIVHSEELLSISSLHDAKAKILELKVTTKSKVVGIPIQDLVPTLPEKCSLTLIENRGRIMAAKENRILAPGDRAFVFTTPEHVMEIKGLF